MMRSSHCWQIVFPVDSWFPSPCAMEGKPSVAPSVPAVPHLPELPSEEVEEVDDCGQVTHKAQESPLIPSVFFRFCRTLSPFFFWCLFVCFFAGWNSYARFNMSLYWLPTTALRLIPDCLLLSDVTRCLRPVVHCRGTDIALSHV